MSAYDNNPKNTNQLYSDKFRFVVHDLPYVVYFCSQSNLPGTSMTDIAVSNPINKAFFGSTKKDFEPLVLNFRVDEDLKNYKEIVNWIIGYSAPTDTDEFKSFITKRQVSGKAEYNIYSDATLVSLTNMANANVKIIFRDMFPVSISGLNFSVDVNQPVQASVTFYYNNYAFV